MEKTGSLREIQGEMKYEWKIKDFLLLEDKRHSSPEFSFYGVSWAILIHPYGNGNERGETAGYINLFLAAMSLPKPVTVNVSLSFKAVEKKSDLELTYTHLFENEEGWGPPRFILRSELVRRKAELLPSGNLTVICTLKNSQSHVTGVSVLQQQFKEILLTEKVSDVVLKVEGREFKSHRCVLAARSPVFLAMLTHDTKEKNTGVVDIQDADPKMFPDFLHYLYTASEEIITPENVVELFTVADKYQVDELKQNCLDFMLENISVGNFCDIISLSLKHQEQDLTDECSEFFIENSLPILKTPKWLTFVTKNPVAANELTIKYVENNTK